ncbi:hypothetical protein LG047_17470 [Methylocystis sp. WRRC1]|uniref:hypothetical protein n=1 Tax=Methylocystis sp. WRRC1 TaxID=1732014 RepID=UPI001D150A3B|nr:hypothetical protein [Methylocystis sp. WRRC1]MCC3247080.1 hypothetical protein [Methylocystis sp. WRRC1]
MKFTGLTAALFLFSFPALADQKAADACAARLPKNSAAIYSASAAKYSPGSDMRDIVKGVARGMVMSGALGRDDARPAAEAAGACLKLMVN